MVQQLSTDRCSCAIGTAISNSSALNLFEYSTSPSSRLSWSSQRKRERERERERKTSDATHRVLNTLLCLDLRERESKKIIIDMLSLGRWNVAHYINVLKANQRTCPEIVFDFPIRKSVGRINQLCVGIVHRTREWCCCWWWWWINRLLRTPSLENHLYEWEKEKEKGMRKAWISVWVCNSKRKKINWLVLWFHY